MISVDRLITDSENGATNKDENPAKRQKPARNMVHYSQKTGQNLHGLIVSTERTQEARPNNDSPVIHRRHSVQRLCTVILASIFTVYVLDTCKEASAPFHKRKDQSELSDFCRVLRAKLNKKPASTFSSDLRTEQIKQNLLSKSISNALPMASSDKNSRSPTFEGQ